MTRLRTENRAEKRAAVLKLQQLRRLLPRALPKALPLQQGLEEAACALSDFPAWSELLAWLCGGSGVYLRWNTGVSREVGEVQTLPFYRSCCHEGVAACRETCWRLRFLSSPWKKLKLLVGYSLSRRTVPSALVYELFYPSLATDTSQKRGSCDSPSLAVYIRAPEGQRLPSAFQQEKLFMRSCALHNVAQRV